MGRLKEEERNLKLKAARDAFEYLKIESVNKNKNLAIPERIVKFANSYEYVKEFKYKLNIQSIKQPYSEEFKILKNEIDEFKENFNISKNSISKLTKSRIDNLNEKIYLLTFQLSELLDNEIKLKEELDNLKEVLKHSNNARDSYYSKLCELNEN